MALEVLFFSINQSNPFKDIYTHLSLLVASFLCDIGKQYSSRCDATECSVPSEAILFAKRIFIQKLHGNLKSLLMPLKMKVDSSIDGNGKIHLSLRMRKPTICMCENKDADQLCSNCTADQHLCFHHTDTKIPLLLIFKVSISSSFIR